MAYPKSRNRKFLVGLVYVSIGLIIANLATEGLIFSNFYLLSFIIVICVLALGIGIFIRKK